MRRTLLTSLAVVTAALFLAAEASAQPGGGFPGGGFPGGGAPGGGFPGGGFPGGGGGFPGGGFPGGGGGFPGGGRGDRGDRGDRGGGRSGFDPTEMLRRMDQNGNGVIEPNEVSGRGGGFVRGMAERAGLDPNQPLPIDKLAAAGAQFGQDRGRGEERNRDERSRDDRNRDENRSSSSGSGATPAPPSGVQGFGTPTGAAAPPTALGFDVPLTAVAGAPIEQRFDDRVVEYVKENMLKERDLNKNNMLEKSEWTGRWSTPPEESDLNKDGILSFEELCVRIAKRFNLDAQARGGSPGGSPSGSSPGSGPPSGPFGGPPGGDPNRFKTYAESLIRQYDTSKNGMLEREEWSQMRSEHQAADANKDGVITVEELSASLAAYSAGGSGGGGWGSRGDRGSSFGGGGDRGGWGRGPGGDSKSAVAKKSYRISSPVERLPKGLPDFFVRNDTDSDGQISMAEYAATWNDQIAVEFQNLDSNGDGILTPDECVKKY